MPEAMLRSFEYSVGFLRELVGDVPDERWTEMPAGLANHAAWVVGHLAYSCQAIGGEIGMEPWLEDDRKSLFGTGSVPLRERDHYPASGLLIGELDDGVRRVVERVRRDWSAISRQDLPDVRYRAMLPTIGDAVLQVLVAHIAYHVGQTMLWRKAMQMPPLTRFYV